MEGYNATHSQVATKTSMPLVETSQSVSVVTRQQMDDQGSQTVAQAMRYTPGVLTNPYGATHRYDYVAMRGFNDGSVDNIYVDGLKSMGDNGTYSTMQVDPYFLERIDILKGPSSVLYGRSSPGGLVALTTKKPLLPLPSGSGHGRYSGPARGVGFDFSGPVDDDKRIAYRLTVWRMLPTLSSTTTRKNVTPSPLLSVSTSPKTPRSRCRPICSTTPTAGTTAVTLLDGMLHKRNGLRLSDHFFEGEPSIDHYERTQRSFGYQFEHRFNDVFTARQNSVISIPDVDGSGNAGWADVDSNMLNRAYTGGDERLHSFITTHAAEFFTGAPSTPCYWALTTSGAKPTWHGAMAPSAHWMPAIHGTVMAIFRYWARTATSGACNKRVCTAGSGGADQWRHWGCARTG
jgi:iron complex outermembrane receptor protein